MTHRDVLECPWSRAAIGPRLLIVAVGLCCFEQVGD